MSRNSQNLSKIKLIHLLLIVCFIINGFGFYSCASLTSTNYKTRIRAVNKLSDQNMLYDIALQDDNSAVRYAALKHLSQTQLAKATTEARWLEDQLQAVSYISDQIELMNIAQNNNNLDVRKAAFKKLNDNSLDILTHEAIDPTFVLSAKIRLGLISWKEAFSGQGSSNETLGHVVSAAAIVDTPQPTSFDVVLACHKFIQLGDASRIPELIYLLNNYGDVSLAEDYMNCGQSKLEKAGCIWGRSHGYECTTGYSGSNRVRWGSKK